MFINTNLYFINPIIGGDAENILIKMEKQNYKYIRNEDNNLIFEIKNDNTKKEQNINILGKGIYNIVFSIKLLESSTKYNILKTNFGENNFDNLILKISEKEYDDIFIEKYKIEKKNYTNNIIQIFFRGNIYIDKDKRLLGTYIITKKYYNDSTIHTLSLELRLNALINLYDLLDKIDKDKCYYWDLKYVNMGIDEKGNYIILDYDKNTIKEKEEYIIDMHYFGTYIPFFYYNFIVNIPKKQNFKINNNIIYVAGLSDILINLFTPEFTYNVIYKNIIDIYIKIYIEIYSYSKIYEIYNDIQKYINDNILKIINIESFNDYIYIDNYKILDIDRSENISIIKNAYKKKAKKYHPDKHSNNKLFTTKMFEYITNANTILSDEEKKSKYDNFIQLYDNTFNKNINIINLYINKNYELKWKYSEFKLNLEKLRESINKNEDKIKTAKNELNSFHKLMKEKRYRELLMSYILHLLCVYSKSEIELIPIPSQNLKHNEFFESIKFFLSQ